MSKSVLIILHNGVEEIEATASIDLLRRAGLKVTTASKESSLEILGANGIQFKADVNLDSVLNKEFDCLILPGGPGVAGLRADKRVIDLVKKQVNEGKWTAAICAAPTVLKDAGVLGDHPHTAHFSVVDELPNCQTDERVIVSKPIITSRGPGTSIDFALAIIKELQSEEMSNTIHKGICY